MTGRVFWVSAWLFALAWVLAVTQLVPWYAGEQPLVTFGPGMWLLAPLLVGLLVAATRRYDRGRPASRSLSELEAREAVRPSPAPVDVQSWGGPSR